jgi:hypothetical protein
LLARSLAPAFRPDLLREWGLEAVLMGMAMTPAKNGKSGVIDAMRNIRFPQVAPAPSPTTVRCAQAGVAFVRARARVCVFRLVCIGCV